MSAKPSLCNGDNGKNWNKDIISLASPPDLGQGGKKKLVGGGSLPRSLEESAHIAERCSQEVSETAKDILTIHFGDAEPVLYLLS